MCWRSEYAAWRRGGDAGLWPPSEHADSLRTARRSAEREGGEQEIGRRDSAPRLRDPRSRVIELGIAVHAAMAAAGIRD